jgi:hypothetical protein
MSNGDKYLGFSIKEGQNKVVLLYEKAEYIQIIKAANTLGLSPASYLRMIAKPCEVCGHDSVIVNKLSRDIAKNFRGLASVQLYVFINELNLKNIQLTKLKLNHQLSFMLDIPKDSKIYYLERNRYNGSGDTSAVITVFRDGVKMASHLVSIKDEMVYKNND